ICAPANKAIAHSGVRFALRMSSPGTIRALYRPAITTIDIVMFKLCEFFTIYIADDFSNQINLHFILEISFL
mgnify:CR=1